MVLSPRLSPEICVSIETESHPFVLTNPIHGALNTGGQKWLISPAGTGTGKRPGIYDPRTETKKEDDVMEKWVCTLCGYEHEGPLPADFECPLCGAGPEDFEKVEE